MGMRLTSKAWAWIAMQSVKAHCLRHSCHCVSLCCVGCLQLSAVYMCVCTCLHAFMHL